MPHFLQQKAIAPANILAPGHAHTFTHAYYTHIYRPQKLLGEVCVLAYATRSGTGLVGAGSSVGISRMAKVSAAAAQKKTKSIGGGTSFHRGKQKDDNIVRFTSGGVDIGRLPLDASRWMSVSNSERRVNKNLAVIAPITGNSTHGSATMLIRRHFRPLATDYSPPLSLALPSSKCQTTSTYLTHTAMPNDAFQVLLDAGAISLRGVCVDAPARLNVMDQCLLQASHCLLPGCCRCCCSSSFTTALPVLL